MDSSDPEVGFYCFSTENSVEDYSVLNLNLPPIFDKYEDDEVCAASVEGECALVKSGRVFNRFVQQITNVIDAFKFQVFQDYRLVDFQTTNNAAVDKESYCPFLPGYKFDFPSNFYKSTRFKSQRDSFGYGYGLELFFMPNQRIFDLTELHNQSRHGLFEFQGKRIFIFAKESCYSSICGYLINYATRSSLCSTCWFVNKGSLGVQTNANAIISNIEAPSYSLGSNYKHMATPQEAQEFPCSFRFVWAATMVETLRSFWLFGKVVYDELIRLVQGGWWGGWHKGMLTLRRKDEVRFKIQCATRLLLVFLAMVVLLVFDPGGLRLQELRSILF